MTLTRVTLLTSILGLCLCSLVFLTQPSWRKTSSENRNDGAVASASPAANRHEPQRPTFVSTPIAPPTALPASVPDESQVAGGLQHPPHYNYQKHYPQYFAPEVAMPQERDALLRAAESSPITAIPTPVNSILSMPTTFAAQPSIRSEPPAIVEEPKMPVSAPVSTTLRKMPAFGDKRLKVMLQMGEGLPKFEVRDGDEVLLKVESEAVDVRSADRDESMLSLKATKRVRFLTPGGEGACDELLVGSGSSEVVVAGNVHFKYNRGKNETSFTSDRLSFRFGTTPTPPVTAAAPTLTPAALEVPAPTPTPTYEFKYTPLVPSLSPPVLPTPTPLLTPPAPLIPELPKRL